MSKNSAAAREIVEAVRGAETVDEAIALLEKTFSSLKVSTRCCGVTKKGVQCKNSAKVNGACRFHQSYARVADTDDEETVESKNIVMID